jgi:hypothetical protein
MFDIKTKRFETPHMAELAYLATLIAIEAPARANKHASQARIPWPLIDRLREILDKDGLDWRRAVNERARVESERRIAETRRRYPDRAEEI